MLLSRLDYCNSLYVNAPVTQMRRLQMIFNMAACVVSGRRRFNKIIDFIKRELHWLPVIERVQFKICTWFSRQFTIIHQVTLQNLLFRLWPSLDDAIYVLHLNKFSYCHDIAHTFRKARLRLLDQHCGTCFQWKFVTLQNWWFFVTHLRNRIVQNCIRMMM